MGNSSSNDNNEASEKSAGNEEKTEPDIDMDSLPEYTIEEVAKHDSKEKKVWIVLNKLVYDVTEFLPFHPGGAGFLLEVAGEDATTGIAYTTSNVTRFHKNKTEFDAAIHSESARIKAKEYIIGKLKIDKTKKQGLSIPTSLDQTNIAPKVHTYKSVFSDEIYKLFSTETAIKISINIQHKQCYKIIVNICKETIQTDQIYKYEHQ